MVCTAPHHHIPRAVAMEVGVNILSEGSGHGKGILGAQDHRAWAPGDSWGWLGGNGGQTDRVSTGSRLQNPSSPTGPPLYHLAPHPDQRG